MKERVIFGKRVWWSRAMDAKPEEGRAWMHLGDVGLGVEWQFGRRVRLCHIHLDLGHVEPSIMISASFPRLFGIYLTAESSSFWRWLPKRNRTLGVRVCSDSIYLSLWEDRDCSSSDDPWWWSFRFNPADVVLGASKYSRSEGESSRVQVPLPEGCYGGDVELYEARWKRPRWPFVHRVKRARIELEVPIPVPGKGESDWDCGDDAVYSLTVSAQTPERAIGAMVESVLTTRRRYGGQDWVPSDGWPALKECVSSGG